MKKLLFLLTFVILSYIMFIMGVGIIERTISVTIMMFALSDRSNW